MNIRFVTNGCKQRSANSVTWRRAGHVPWIVAQDNFLMNLEGCGCNSRMCPKALNDAPVSNVMRLRSDILGDVSGVAACVRAHLLIG